MAKRSLLAVAPLRAVGALGLALAACDVPDEATRRAAPNDPGVSDAATAPTDAASDAGPAKVPPEVTGASPVMRRLSRADYLNSVRDLVGDFTVEAHGLPFDQLGYLFPNIGGTQSLERFDLERYLAVAEEVAARAWSRRRETPTRLRVTVTGAVASPADGFAGDGAMRLDDDVELATRVPAPRPGDIALHLRARLVTAPAGPVRVEARHEGLLVGSVDVPFRAGDAVDAVLVARLPWRSMTVTEAGPRVTLRAVGVTADAPLLLAVDHAESPVLSDEQRIAVCDPVATGADACLRQVIAPFARRAWRRPLADDDLAALVSLGRERMSSGDSFDDAAQAVLTAVLVSPRFLFRAERTADAQEARDAHELAAELSYLLWASMPDAALRESAESGRLLDPAEVDRQVRRMVADPRFDGFIRTFAGQWLSFNGAAQDPVNVVDPAAPRPDNETALFLTALFRENAPISSLLDADWTYLDARLARVYGYAGSLPDEGFVRVSLASLPRRGVLTQPSFLSLTSLMTQVTQPTVRGYYVLSRILCDEPSQPAMPFDNFLTEFNNMSGMLSMRQVLEAHRARPECATCHAVMDPVGFAFENYDGLGAYRTYNRGLAIDASATVEGVGTYHDALELVSILGRDARVPACVTRHLMTYALGRGELDDARDGLDSIRAGIAPGGARMLDLLVAAAQSPAFRARGGRGGH